MNIMNAHIKTIRIPVEIQENGIIRNFKGRYIARLEKDVEFGGKHITGMLEENDGSYRDIIKQVLHNPQVSPPALSYKITDMGSEGYTSEYIDKKDFDLYVKRLEKTLLYRLENNSL